MSFARGEVVSLQELQMRVNNLSFCPKHVTREPSFFNSLIMCTLFIKKNYIAENN